MKVLLAAAVIFDDTLCGFTRGHVSVELLSNRVQGMTHWSPDGERTPHEVALEVDADRFFTHFFEVLG